MQLCLKMKVRLESVFSARGRYFSPSNLHAWKNLPRIFSLLPSATKAPDSQRLHVFVYKKKVIRKQGCCNEGLGGLQPPHRNVENHFSEICGICSTLKAVFEPSVGKVSPPSEYLWRHPNAKKSPKMLRKSCENLKFQSSVILLAKNISLLLHLKCKRQDLHSSLQD